MAKVPAELEAAWETLSEAQGRIRAQGIEAGVQGLLQAVQQFRRAGDRSSESYALGLLAGAHNELGNFAQAAEYSRAGLEAARSLAKPGTRTAQHLDSLGIALANMGKWPEAEAAYREALEDTRKPVRDLREMRARIMKHMADGYLRYANRADKAIRMYDDAIAISKEYGDKGNVAAALNFKGQALDHLGRPEEALHCYEQARVIAEEKGEKGMLAACYAHLGAAYLHLGNVALAHQYVDQALVYDREHGNKQGICRDLWLLGRIQDDEGQEKATETMEEAFLIAREIGDLKLMIFILMRLAQASNRRLQGKRAEEYLREALKYAKELGDKQAEIEIAASLAAFAGYAEVFEELQKGIAIAREQGLVSLEQDLQASLGAAYEKHGYLVRAREHYEESARLLEKMREGYQAEQHLRAFSENTAGTYERLVDISLQLRQTADAFAWAERSRARVLQIMRKNRSLHRAASMPEAQRRQYRETCDRIIALDREIQQLERKGSSVPQALRERLQEALLVEIDTTLAARRASGLAGGDGGRLEVSPEQLMAALAKLPQRVLALSYYIGDSGVYVFYFMGKTFDVCELGTGGVEVRDAIGRFRAKLGVPESRVRDDAGSDDAATRDPVSVRGADVSEDHLPDGRKLYDLLLRPMEAMIGAADHVCIIPHGPLHFLPFHALHDGERYLIERLPVSYAPSATILVQSLESANLSIGRALALGEPECDLKPLPHAREEVARVREILGKEKCREAVGAQAVRSLVFEAGRRRAEAGRDDVWHFAMHALFVQAAPHLSYLQFARSEGDDGRLFAYEIAALEQVAALTVMSACRTAMTREARGDELSGLLFSFLVAGAQTVLATLWSVADRSTSELMAKFYGELKDPKISMAEALRRAQIALLRTPSTSSPYHWAAVALYCNWNPVGARSGGAAEETAARRPETSVPAVPVEVLLRQADSVLARARIEHEKQSWSLLGDGEKEALQQAMGAYGLILDRKPDHAGALRQRGIAHYCLHQIDEAGADLLKACGLNDADPVAAAVLGLIYAEYKADDRAAALYLERALRLKPRIELEYPARRTYPLRSAMERCRAAVDVEEYTRKLAEAPDNAALYTERGQAYWMLSIKGRNYQEDQAKAIQDLNRALELDPNDALALVRRTWIEDRGGGPSEPYERAVRMDPGCAEAHLRLAQSLGKEASDRAVAEIRAALECDASIEHAYCRLAIRHLDRGELRPALEAFETEAGRNPNCFDAYLYLTQIYAALGRIEDARHALRESIRTTPHTPHEGGPGVGLLDSIVYAIRDLARGTKAEEASGPALSLTQITSLFDRANDAANEGRTADAVEIYTEILRRDPKNVRAYAFRGGCYATLKQADLAIGDLQKATNLNPNNADAWYNLALVYYTQMRYPESSAAMERARMLDPEMVRRREAADAERAAPRAQTEPFDLNRALAEAYRQSAMRCAHCDRHLRRPLGTQFAILPENVERVREGIPYYCPLCRTNSCVACAARTGEATVACGRCGTEMAAWGEARQVRGGRDSGGNLVPAGPCAVCGRTGPRRLGKMCSRCYDESARAIAQLNFEGRTSGVCLACRAVIPVQLGEAFADGPDDLKCKKCFAAELNDGGSR
jgi:CHAT domain-containing protein/Tfp pilus assembly protein PilF